MSCFPTGFFGFGASSTRESTNPFQDYATPPDPEVERLKAIKKSLSISLNVLLRRLVRGIEADQVQYFQLQKQCKEFHQDEDFAHAELKAREVVKLLHATEIKGILKGHIEETQKAVKELQSADDAEHVLRDKLFERHSKCAREMHIADMPAPVQWFAQQEKDHAEFYQQWQNYQRSSTTEAITEDEKDAFAEQINSKAKTQLELIVAEGSGKTQKAD